MTWDSWAARADLLRRFFAAMKEAKVNAPPLSAEEIETALSELEDLAEGEGYLHD